LCRGRISRRPRENKKAFRFCHGFDAEEFFVQGVSFLRLTSQQNETTIMSDPAAKLCEQAKAGDREAAAELVSSHYERLFAWFRRVCGHDEDAADLTQKTFCQAWLSLASYQGRSSFSTWLHGIGYHLYIDWRRALKESVQLGDEWWLNCPHEGPSPFENAAEKELAARLYALVDQFAEETRETMHLHYYQGLSIAETAEVMGIATSTVKYRLREAIGLLKLRTAEPRLRVR
jgi:RNA polymerase sigma-70 factor (ECF subfamily)